MQKFFKVYEILDNVSEIMASYPTYFVGAFTDKKMAQALCKNIDIADCNSTKIEYGYITKSDVNDLKKFGLQGADQVALNEISKILKREAQENVR